MIKRVIGILLLICCLLPTQVVFGNVSTYEVEDLPYTTSEKTQVTRRDEDSPTVSSYLFMEPTALESGAYINKYIQIPLSIEQEGTYKVEYRVKTGYQRGIYQLSVDGEDVGEPVDNYTLNTAYSIFEVGYINVENAGIKNFRFTCTGANSAATKSGVLYIDFIRLVRITERPLVFWTSNRALPGRVVMSKGENLGDVRQVKICVLDNDSVWGIEPMFTRRTEAHSMANSDGVLPYWDDDGETEAQLVQYSSQAVKFIIPEGFPDGVYSVKFSGGMEAEPFYLNHPTVEWIQGNMGNNATPGGWIRILGKNLSLDESRVTVVLESQDREFTWLTPEKVYNQYSVGVKIPNEIPEGIYKLYLHNGYGGQTAFSQPMELEIETNEAWSQIEYNVKTFGATGDGVTDDTRAVKTALYEAGKNGGGVVYFPRGRYHLTDSLQIPQYTEIRGEGRELVRVYWSPYRWDFGELPYAMISGTHHFAVSDITLEASRAGSIIVSEIGTETAGHIYISRTRIRANPFVGHIDTTIEKRISDEIGVIEKLDAVKLGGENIQLVDNIFDAASRSFSINTGKGVYIKGNEFYNGYKGWYSFGGPRGVIFEDNQVIGADQTATGGSINNLGFRYSENVYFSGNSFRRIVGNDREPITMDGGGGVYVGGILSISGESIVLPDEGAQTTWSADDEWKGAAVFILSGSGAGQYRQIVSHTKSTIILDQPFAAEPDETSTISITALNRNGIYVNNSFEDTGAFQFYGTAINMIVDGNKMTRGAGMHSWGRFVYGGNQPNWYVEMANNEILEGYYTHWYGAESTSGMSYLRVSTQGGYVLNLGATIRDNILHNNSYIHVTGGNTECGLRDAIIEKNLIKNSDSGIVISGGVDSCLLSDNRYENVTNELSVANDLIASKKVIIKD